MTMHRLPDKKAAISSLQREDGGEMKIVQEGIKSMFRHLHWIPPDKQGLSECGKSPDEAAISGVSRYWE